MSSYPGPLQLFCQTVKHSPFTKEDKISNNLNRKFLNERLLSGHNSTEQKHTLTRLLSGHNSTEQKHILTLHEQQHILSSVMIHSNHNCMLSGIVAESMNSLTTLSHKSHMNLLHLEHPILNLHSWCHQYLLKYINIQNGK